MLAQYHMNTITSHTIPTTGLIRLSTITVLIMVIKKLVKSHKHAHDLSNLCTNSHFTNAWFYELGLTRELTNPRVGVIPSLFLD